MPTINNISSYYQYNSKLQSHQKELKKKKKNKSITVSVSKAKLKSKLKKGNYKEDTRHFLK